MVNVNQNSRLQLSILNQYIKDLSYENPQTITSIMANKQSPDVSLSMNALFQSFEKDCFGVTLEIKCNLIFETHKLFHLELYYFGFFKIINTNHSFDNNILTNEGSRLIFPFARSIVASITQNGGSIPILLDNMDFNLIKNTN